MRLYEIESNDVTSEGIIDELVSKCKEHNCMKSLLDSLKGNVFLMHVERRGGEKDNIRYIPIKRRDTATDTPYILHDYYNKVQKDTFGVDFRSYFFTYPYDEKALSEVAPGRYIVFPTDNAKYGMSDSENPNDFFMRFSTKNLKLKENFEEEVKKIDPNLSEKEIKELSFGIDLSHMYTKEDPNPLKTFKDLVSDLDNSEEIVKCYKEQYLDKLFEFVEEDARNFSTSSSFINLVNTSDPDKPEIMIYADGAVLLSANILYQINKNRENKLKRKDFIEELKNKIAKG